MEPMDATRGRLIARTSRYPLGFDHRSSIKKCLKCPFDKLRDFV
jgi:hypothetical protein